MNLLILCIASVCAYTVLGGIRQDILYNHFLRIGVKIGIAALLVALAVMSTMISGDFGKNCERELNGVVCTQPDGSLTGYIFIKGRWFDITPDTVRLVDTLFIAPNPKKK